MRKILVILTGVVAVAAAAWSGLWFYGKGRIAEEIKTQAQLIRTKGGDAAFDAIEISGFPFGYTGRITDPKFSMTREMPDRTSGGFAQAVFTWSAPWIEASADVMAPNSVEFIFPETQEVLLELPEMEGGPLPVSVASKDMKFTTERSGDDILFRGGATAISGSLSQDTEKSGKIEITYAMRALQTSGKFPQKQTDTKPPQFAMTYSIDGFDGTTVVAGSTEKPGGKINLTGGKVAAESNSLGTETTGTATLNDIVASFQLAQFGNQPLDITIGKIATKTRIPSDPAPGPQAFEYKIGIEDISLADLIWTMIDSQKAYVREINALTIDMDGTAVFTATPSNAEAFAKAMENGLPIDVKTLRLNDLTVDAIGLKASGKGEGTLENDVPEGTAALAIEGFPTLMNSLVKSGRIPPQQAMVVQLMVESFGKMDEDEKTVRFDFEAKDGTMYVNSIPIGEAPTLPR